MLVVGGKTSANTRHLLEVCREEGASAYHIETAERDRGRVVRGCERVGVTAGASTPDSAVEAVVAALRIAAEPDAKHPGRFLATAATILGPPAF